MDKKREEKQSWNGKEPTRRFAEDEKERRVSSTIRLGEIRQFRRINCARTCANQFVYKNTRQGCFDMILAHVCLKKRNVSFKILILNTKESKGSTKKLAKFWLAKNSIKINYTLESIKTSVINFFYLYFQILSKVIYNQVRSFHAKCLTQMH